ncbi:MAG TPA: hypothetical protein VH061_09350 [Solirubrobacteraceae bacterium]|jgi:hypothetical protein|nr:hypothetical protein [Solirubrobacteraceae bacterium]
MLRRWDFWRASLVTGSKATFWLFGALTLVIGGSVLGYWQFASRRPLVVILGSVAAVLVLMEAAYRRWDESDVESTELREQRDRELIPPGHLDGLRQMLALTITAVEHELQATYAEPNPVGEPIHREAFAAHFPSIAQRLDEWDASLFQCGQAEGAFGHRLLQAMTQAGMTSDPFYGDKLLEYVRNVMLHRANVGGESGPVHIAWTGYGGELSANGHKVALVPFEDGESEDAYRERVKADVADPVDALMAEAHGWPEIGAVAKAHLEHHLAQDRQTVLGELRGLTKVEKIGVSSGCRICRGNRGELD